MTEKDYLLYWLETAEEDLKTAEGLFKLGRYHHCLFFCHLALEKLIKGLVFKNTKEHALPIHNLVKLAQQAKLILIQSQQEDLKEITSWNIRARYDSIKREFYKKATKDFTTSWLSKVKKLYLWLKNQY